LLDEAFSGIRVHFGGSHDVGQSSTFAVEGGAMVASSYGKRGGQSGGIAAIGPVRLDYKKVIPYVEYFTAKMTELLSRNDED
jgi:heat-inducible transcriptional repressor